MPEQPADGAALPAAFGKYFLTEKLATGGMAEIYLAKLIGPGGFEKSLVIKQIHPRLSGQRHFVDLFVAEAKTLVTLAHGNIVPVYELGVIDDTYFIAMDYIDGPTLYRLTEAVRRRGARMEPAVAAWITARILEGLAYAHRKGEGVIHRDLSPRNVMLSRDGEVKLVDFGIAVTLGAASDDASQSAPTGSFPYMSPEQVRKEPLTAQSDLFSVGVLCWEMLVGHRLFARPDADATLRAVVESDIAKPSDENPEVPARLSEVVMRALERDTTARWATADDMLAALHRYLYALDETPGPRDIAALVGRYCPPETRRLPTHADPLDEAHDPIDERGSAAEWQRGVVDEPAPTGPMTAVIPRDGAPRGRKSPRARTETFATHSALDELMGRARTTAENEAITDDAGASGASTQVATKAPEPDPDAPIPRPASLPGPPSIAVLLIVGAGTVALGIGAVYVFFRGRDAVERSDRYRPEDRYRASLPFDVDAAVDVRDAGSAADAAPADAAPAYAAPVDAGAADAPLLHPPVDAAPRNPRDPRPTPDAHAAPEPRPTGTATLTVGANPWGDVVLDGKPLGHTPLEKLTVPAGRHVVRVTFGGEDPPRTLSYTLDLAAGEIKDVLADFTKP